MLRKKATSIVSIAATVILTMSLTSLGVWAGNLSLIEDGSRDEPVMVGDLNADGKIDSTDAAILRRLILGMPVGPVYGIPDGMPIRELDRLIRNHILGINNY